MAQIIEIREFRAGRKRARQRTENYRNAERALSLMRESLMRAAEQLDVAPIAEHPELLERIEKLAATIRYGMVGIG
jgi:hypothetical protein